MSNSEIKYRKNYKQPAHWIDKVELTIDLFEDYVLVYSKLFVKVNPNDPASTLILNGENQELLEVKLNTKTLTADHYQLTHDSLTVVNTPDEFILELTSKINPQENVALMGLYNSGGNFCTQCEAEGFRRISYYIDRPDVMAVFTTTVIAKKEKYPVLLSNGNLIEKGNLKEGRHYAKWHDPFKKPCYLFAMIAGNLAVIEDYFVTCSKRKVTLRIFAARNVIAKCHYAMQALKKAMKWDEEIYGREYDLDIFMIVAVNDFNFGAMENKCLNIFNDKYILVDSKTATDLDYSNIDAVVGHEYFHNWSGNRVTVRDWFQLSLKEGFTVFRDHSFSEAVGSKAIQRIEQIKKFRTFQFPEDAGPLAHSVRPDSYMEINNFYTVTIYEKGAEVIRMLQTILGPEKFRKGTDLYFSRNDGKAVSCDDFVQALQDASDIDLTLFKKWYNQAGTPIIKVTTAYDQEKASYRIRLQQSCLPTPGQPHKDPLHIPFAFGLLNKAGEDIPLQSRQDLTSSKTYVINFTEKDKEFTFINIAEKPIPSLLRHFSAPVKLEYNYSEEELAFLMAKDNDAVARWEASQQLATLVLFKLMKQYQAKEKLTKPQQYLDSLNTLLKDRKVDKALVAEMFTLPEINYLIELVDKIDVEALVSARKFLQNTIAETLQTELLVVYKENLTQKPYEYNSHRAAERALKNIALFYLILAKEDAYGQLGYEQFKAANNMTDEYAALCVLVIYNVNYQQEVLEMFYQKWQSDHLVIDKWFAVQARIIGSNTLERVKTLLKHPAFNIKNPNKVRALLGSFVRNFECFHTKDGKSYEFITEQIIQLDKINPMGAARLVTVLSQWRKFDEVRQQLMKDQLIRIKTSPSLSTDVLEIVSKSLED